VVVLVQRDSYEGSRQKQNGSNAYFSYSARPRARERSVFCNDYNSRGRIYNGSHQQLFDLVVPFVALGIVVPFGNPSAQSPTVSIETDYLMTLEGICEQGQPIGQRLIVNCTGGPAHGPKINATVIPPTGDWLIP